MRELLEMPEVAAQLKVFAATPVDDVTALSDVIQVLFDLLGHEDVGELFAAAAEAQLLSPARAGHALNVAGWSGSTNGGDLQPTLERWLSEGKDPLRVGLALQQDPFPFRGLEEMRSVLARISVDHPSFANLCAKLVAQRVRQGV